MPSKQTRRSISVRGTTYEKLREYCATTSRSMSDVVEEQLANLLPQLAKPTRTVAPRVARAVAATPRIVATPGRPAPTPAAQVVARRVEAPRGDYRMIRF